MIYSKHLQRRVSLVAFGTAIALGSSAMAEDNEVRGTKARLWWTPMIAGPICLIKKPAKY